MKITEQTTVEEALRLSRDTAKILKKYDLGCASCKGSGQDSIRNVARNNGLDLAMLLKELNEALK